MQGLTGMSQVTILGFPTLHEPHPEFSYEEYNAFDLWVVIG